MSSPTEPSSVDNAAATLIESLTIQAPRNIQASEENPWCICPFNTRHRMPGKSLVSHLKSCPDRPKKKPQGPLVCCPFNTDHRIAQDSLEEHKQKCPNRPRPRRNSSPKNVPCYSSSNQMERRVHKSQHVFVFDLETDSLTTEFPWLSREEYMQKTQMTVAVGWFDDKYYFFTRAPADLLLLEQLMDLASIIVIQNHSFDLGVLEKYYPHRHGLVSWHHKIWDYYEACRALFGCPYPLDSLAEFNKDVPPKLGASEDAPTLWRQGKLLELFQYCKRDVEILCQLYNKRASLRIPVRKDTISTKKVGVVTMNFTNGVVPASQGKYTFNKRVKELVNCVSLGPKCPVCAKHSFPKYPTKVVFEDNGDDEEEILEAETDDIAATVATTIAANALRIRSHSY